MSSIENNKVFAALLTAGIAFVGFGIVSEDVIHPKRLEHPAIKIKGEDVAPAAGAGGAPAAKALPPLGPLLAKASIPDGEALTKKVCVACHNFQEGQGNKVGPLLYGVMGRDRASEAGYTYSAALKGKSGKWTWATLNEWLAKPSAFAPGTKMAYAGIEDSQIRADVVDYLHTLSPSPEPMPPATEGAEPAPASGAAPAAAPAAPPAAEAPKVTPAPGTPAPAAPASPPPGKG